ncbi:MAG: ATP-binding protein [Gammaproteobacteria bacterium]
MGRLFWKIFIGFWLTLLLVGLTVGSLVWLHNRDRIEQLELLVDSPRADMGITNIANILRYGGEPALKEVAERRTRRHGRPMPIMIVNDQGKDLLDRPVPYVMLEKARKALQDSESSTQQVTTPGGNRYLLFLPRRDHPAMNNPFYVNHLPFIPLLALFLVSLIFCAGLAWYITRPLRILSLASRQFADGELDTRVMPSMGTRKDEIADLGQDFDYMAQQIQLLISSQKRLLNDVSHELRSPLARLQVAVEMSRQQPERINELLQRIEKESHRLDELVGELLTLSRLEAGAIEIDNDYFDINGLITSIIEDARFETVNMNKSIAYEGNKEVVIKGHVELLRRAIENIVRNALFHTPENSQISIDLEHNDSQIGLTICDMGKGVAEEKLSKLFQPFVRIDENNQNIKIPGYGLGLAIAKRAVELHGGKIMAFNQSTGGLCIQVQLPIFSEQDTE